MFTLPIYNDSAVHPAFVKANLAILKKYQDNFQTDQLPEEKTQTLKLLWKQEYGLELIEKQNQLEAINFKSQADLTMFLIRWG